MNCDWRGEVRGYGHTTIARLKRCEGYHEAKNGSLDAAEFVILQCIKWERVRALREQYPSALLLPVISKNQLPYALASVFALPVYTGVRLLHTKSRTRMTAIERLMHRPVFVGTIPKGAQCIIVDDVITQGGTVAALRRHILSQGGTVVAVVALAYAVGSSILSPSEENINEFLRRFSFELPSLLNAMGIAASSKELTNSQIRYLLRFRCFENILIKMSGVIEHRRQGSVCEHKPALDSKMAL